MAEPKPSSRSRSWSRLVAVFVSAATPILAAVLGFQLHSFDPAPMPYQSRTSLIAGMKNERMLQDAELVGVGMLDGPEDIAYDSETEMIYTGCADGWIKKVTVNSSAVSGWLVDNWVSTGGRPLGLAIARNREVFVADAFKGLLKISANGTVELLADEAEGVKFKITDGVAIADDGVVYFTDASYKYDLDDFILDILEGKPHGRLLSYDGATKETKVLAEGLYFANGVALSPAQDYAVFCESPLRRCSKYFIEGEKKGLVERFIESLPGMPDNIHRGDGGYWIALATEATMPWIIALEYPLIRKAMGIVYKTIGRRFHMENGGVFLVDWEGNPRAHYCDPSLGLISTGVQIGTRLYCGSLGYPYIIRLDLGLHPPV